MFGGYNFLYWSDVLRLVNQIGPIKPFLAPALGFGGPRATIAAPRVSISFGDSEFWAQWLSAGLEFRW